MSQLQQVYPHFTQHLPAHSPIIQGRKIMYLTKDSSSPFFKLVYFDTEGNRKRVSTKETTRRKAEVFMHHFKPENCNPVIPIINEVAPAENIAIPGSTISLKEFHQEYLEIAKQTRSKHYYISIDFSFKKLIKYTGDHPLQTLDRKTMEKFISATFAKKKSSAAHIYKALKAAFSKAEDWGYISTNPFKLFKAPKIAKCYPFFITLSDLTEILKQESRKYYRDLYSTAFYTGMRRAEIINLCWESVDLDNNLIKVSNCNGFTTKSKKERLIPICEPLQSILKERKAEPQNKLYVFTTSFGKKFHDESVGKQFKKAVRAAKLNDKIHFHTLRHSFASILVQNGVSIYVVKELLGHEDIKTTEIYAHLQNESLVKAVTVFDQKILKTA